MDIYSWQCERDGLLLSAFGNFLVIQPLARSNPKLNLGKDIKKLCWNLILPLRAVLMDVEGGKDKHPDLWFLNDTDAILGHQQEPGLCLWKCLILATCFPTGLLLWASPGMTFNSLSNASNKGMLTHSLPTQLALACPPRLYISTIHKH